MITRFAVLSKYRAQTDLRSALLDMFNEAALLDEQETSLLRTQISKNKLPLTWAMLEHNFASVEYLSSLLFLFGLIVRKAISEEQAMLCIKQTTSEAFSIEQALLALGLATEFLKAPITLLELLRLSDQINDLQFLHGSEHELMSSEALPHWLLHNMYVSKEVLDAAMALLAVIARKRLRVHDARELLFAVSQDHTSIYELVAEREESKKMRTPDFTVSELLIKAGLLSRIAAQQLGLSTQHSSVVVARKLLVERLLPAEAVSTVLQVHSLLSTGVISNHQALEILFFWLDNGGTLGRSLHRLGYRVPIRMQFCWT